MAYHAIAPTQVARIDLPSRSLSAGYTRVPGYLIGRLALDQTLHGQALGTQLLLDARERIAEAADRATGRLIAVDATDDTAHRFHRHHGLQAITHSSRLSSSPRPQPPCCIDPTGHRGWSAAGVVITPFR